jgi:hypothetical protein
MMLKVTIPAGAGSKAIKEGTMQRVLSRLAEEIKPEAAYFTAEGGHRTGFWFFDLKDPTEIPSLAEPIFSALDAEIEFVPAMNYADLKVGLDKVSKKT